LRITWEVLSMMTLLRKLAPFLFPSSEDRAAEQELLYPNEQSCAVSLLSTEAVQTLYKTLGTDPDVIKTRLIDLRSHDENPRAVQVLDAGSLWHQQMVRLPFPLEQCLLIGLLIHGTREIQEALTPLAGKPGDIPFFVAHKQRETELRSVWPALGEQTGHVVLMNDPFSPMEAVVHALEVSFGMERETAVQKMLDVHRSGSSVIEIGLRSNASDTCGRLNAEWRSVGLPLYCVPQR
jgi:ATP-dependent Clp protease adapter protein ClpS